MLHELTHALGFTSRMLDENITQAVQPIEIFLDDLFFWALNDWIGSEQERQEQELNRALEELDWLNLVAYIDNDSTPIERPILRSLLGLAELEQAFRDFNRTLAAHGYTLSQYLVLRKMAEASLDGYARLGATLLGAGTAADRTQSEQQARQLHTLIVESGYSIHELHDFAVMCKAADQSESLMIAFMKPLIFLVEAFLRGDIIDEDFRLRSQIAMRKIQEANPAIPLALGGVDVIIATMASADQELPPNYTFFDQYVTDSQGVQIASMTSEQQKEYIAKIRAAKTGAHRHPRFSGPNVRRYLPRSVLLAVLDSAHLAMSEPDYFYNSSTKIMKPQFDDEERGQELEWGPEETAILLDLGYRVENAHTRRWQKKEPVCWITPNDNLT